MEISLKLLARYSFVFVQDLRRVYAFSRSRDNLFRVWLNFTRGYLVSKDEILYGIKMKLLFAEQFGGIESKFYMRFLISKDIIFQYII